MELSSFAAARQRNKAEDRNDGEQVKQRAAH
jgi:hypothetical protein